jgi:hypothetical protein
MYSQRQYHSQPTQKNYITETTNHPAERCKMQQDWWRDYEFQVHPTDTKSIVEIQAGDKIKTLTRRIVDQQSQWPVATLKPTT